IRQPLRLLPRRLLHRPCPGARQRRQRPSRQPRHELRRLQPAQVRLELETAAGAGRMTGEQWIEVCNWDKFQHYKDRDPYFIKNYTALVHDENYRELTAAERGLLHGIWLEYANSH